MRCASCTPVRPHVLEDCVGGSGLDVVAEGAQRELRPERSSATDVSLRGFYGPAEFPEDVCLDPQSSSVNLSTYLPTLSTLPTILIIS